MKPAAIGNYVEIASIKKSYRINSNRELVVHIVHKVGAKSSSCEFTGDDALAMIDEDMPEVTERLLTWIDAYTK